MTTHPYLISSLRMRVAYLHIYICLHREHKDNIYLRPCKWFSPSTVSKQNKCYHFLHVCCTCCMSHSSSHNFTRKLRFVSSFSHVVLNILGPRTFVSTSFSDTPNKYITNYITLICSGLKTVKSLKEQNGSTFLKK